MALISLSSSHAAEQDEQVLSLGGGISSRLTGSVTVSHGHGYVVAGEPGFSFGGIKDDQGKWKLNYLVLVKHRATAKSSVDHRNPEPTISFDTSDGTERRLNFIQRLRIDDAILDYSYRGRIDLVTNTLTNEQFTVQGKPMQVKNGRLIVVDMTVEPIRLQQVNADLPATNDVDFANIQPKQYQELTRQWMSELANKSEIVAKQFGP